MIPVYTELYNARAQWRTCLAVAVRQPTPSALAALKRAERAYCALHLQHTATVPPKPTLRFRRVRKSVSSYPIPDTCAA
jgi:hypothetical protein